MLGINWLFNKCEPLIEKACRRLSSGLEDWLIDTGGSPYLHRYYIYHRAREGLKQYLPSIYLHYFYRGDLDRALHNHPWGYSLSLVLTNGYLEDRRTNHGVIRRLKLPGSFNLILANDYHKVTLLDESKGAWTLFISGPRVQENWSFWDPNRPYLAPVHHEDYARAKGDPWLTN